MVAVVTETLPKLWLVAPRSVGDSLAQTLRANGSDTALTGHDDVAPQTLDVVAASFGDIDALVFVAPIRAASDTGAGGDALIEQVAGVLDSFVAVARQAAHHFSKRSGGAIVVVCDVAGVSGHGSPADAVGAGALIGAAKSLAKELGRYDVHVNVVAFGHQPALGMSEVLDERERRLFDMMRLGRPGTLDQLARNIIHCARGGHALTGQVLHADDGLII